jgi:hypothetical protein
MLATLRAFAGLSFHGFRFRLGPGGFGLGAFASLVALAFFAPRFASAARLSSHAVYRDHSGDLGEGEEALFKKADRGTKTSTSAQLRISVKRS